PYQPLAAGVQEKWQTEVEQMRDRFAGVVAQGRGKRMSKAAALKTEAEAYTAAEAVELGLADAVGDSQEAFAAFIKDINGKA
ncbi:MAG: S49 family peptidase, partial [Mesorhizobium sp.]